MSLSVDRGARERQVSSRKEVLWRNKPFLLEIGPESRSKLAELGCHGVIMLFR